VYPGTCREGRASGATADRTPAWRFKVPDATCVTWQDRRLGTRTQQLNEAVGDFVLRRADGIWSYQLAVVVDDAHQGITHVVRGEDLADNTPRQIALQHSLQRPTPLYLHTPLVLNEAGEKLSKQQGALPLDTRHPLQALNEAARALGLSPHDLPVSEALHHWVSEWRNAWVGSLQSGSR
jgi:glutamyl-Q tRNA(Asp) synthetase